MKRDMRTLSHDVLEDIRIRSVRMVIKSQLQNSEVCEIMEIQGPVLSKWIGMYKRGGWKALRSKTTKGGRPKDPQKNLTTGEKKKLRKLLVQQPRDIQQLQLDLSLWTARLVGELIEKIFLKKLKEGQVRKILGELGFSYQKPIFRAYQQNLEKVQEWREVLRPQIEAEAKSENREILYGDEAGFKSTEHRGRTWGEKGKTPVVKWTGARFGINAISAISKNGVMRFMVYEGTFSGETLIEFLEKLIYNNSQKYSLILDGHPTHKTKVVKKWLEEHLCEDGTPQIRLYILLGYSPELNPDEQVWNNVKHDMKGRFSASVKELRTHLLSSLFRLQKKKKLISSFFRHPDFL